MDTIRVEYFINDVPINETRVYFDFENIKSIARHYLTKLQPFATQINSQNGYLKLNISNPKEIPDGFHFEISVMGLNQSLNKEINDASVFKV